MNRTLLPLAVALVVACQPQPPTAPGPAPAPGSAESNEASEPETIVSIIPSATELLFAIGVGDRVVARSTHCNFPPEAMDLPAIGSGLDPDVERIIALGATLVVASRVQQDMPALQTLRAAGIEVLVIPDESVADVFDALRLLGERLDAEASAGRVRAELDAALDAAHPDVAPTPRPRVLVVVGTDPIFAAGGESFVADLVDIAGGVTVARGDWVNLDDESVVALAPEVIVQSARSDAELAHWARFGDAVPAVRSGRVCRVDPDEIGRPGPRVASAARAIRDCILGSRSTGGAGEGSAAAPEGEAE